MIKGFHSWKIQKLKKYLFFISVLFLVSSFTHILYTYLYGDSELIPEKWGTVSEWFIWEFPSLNPIKTLSWNNKYIIQLLYRSIMKYDLENQKIISDLATCDTSNLLYIDCYIKDNSKWSNGEPITNEDILATYQLLQNSNINPIVSSLLSDTIIWEKDNHITFTNTKKDINFLNIFFQPILAKKVIDSLSEEELWWNFKTNDQLYSWDFIITNISRDETVWITKIILEKNPQNNNEDIYIDTYILKFFENNNSLLKNKVAINIFDDDNNLIWESVPRLQKYEYTLPQYVALFLNTEKIKNLEFRNFLLHKIQRENLLKILWERAYKEILNPYLSDVNIEAELINKNFEDILSTMWYQKKSQLLETLIPWKSQSLYSEETQEIKEKIPSLEEYQEKSKTIIDPTFIEKYNFLNKDDILLKWKAGPDTTAVYVNDYQLKWFTPGNPYFYYRIKESFWNIIEGENTYNIYFVSKGITEKILQEEIIIIFNKNEESLETSKNEYLKKIESIQIAENPEEKKVINSEQLQSIQDLDEKYYYNDSLEKLSLQLYYIASEKDIETTAHYIQDTLENIWIEVILTPFPIQNISQILSDKNAYDMIIGWISLWYFSSNIFPYFHSSQEKNGYNFSNIRKPILDDYLEEIKSKIHNSENLTLLEGKVLNILKDEQVIKTLYTPKLSLLVDKNMNGQWLPSYLPNKSLTSEILNNTYIREKKIINFENKWILNFIGFLLTKFYDSPIKG